ncbi:MAG: ABC transporter permease [Tannerellaceae bacterium]|jgi:ABC-2 type transport system permease protein|nr:ABC transporter permease [Tannerellaceae bacterium]
MSKTGIIIKREYLRRVTKKSFLLLTLLMPFLMAALVFVPLWLASIKSGELRTIAVIDATGKYASLFQDTETYRFINSDKALDNYRNASDKGIFAILSITGDLLQNPKAASLYSEKQIPVDLSRMVNQAITRKLENEKLSSFNIPNLKEIIAESKVDFSIQTIKWTEDGKESASSARIASITGMAFTIIIYMFIIMYGSMVMQGVQEEKTNRIVELMVSSVRPFDLMMGKIIGLAFVGLTQLFLWGVMTTFLIVAGMFVMGGGVDPSAIQQGMAMPNPAMAAGAGQLQSSNEIYQIISAINFAEIGVFFVIYFIGGYLLYASVFAAIGSAVSQQEDTQQFMTPVMLLMVFALYAGIYSMENPDGPLAFWCSLIPLSSPVVMMMRLPFEVALWEKLLSVVLLYVTAFGMVWLSSKIYRIGILMYGKKPSLKEIAKWIRYK